MTSFDEEHMLGIEPSDPVKPLGWWVKSPIPGLPAILEIPPVDIIVVNEDELVRLPSFGS